MRYQPSNLPGIEFDVQASPEERKTDGSLVGKSVVSLSKLSSKLMIVHEVSPIEKTWLSVARQRITVWAIYENQCVAQLDLVRAGIDGIDGDPDDDELLASTTIWCARDVRVRFEKYKNKGIAKALYKHAATYGYMISPSTGLHGPGRQLWDSMDRGFVDKLGGDESPISKDGAILDQLFERFGINPDVQRLTLPEHQVQFGCPYLER